MDDEELLALVRRAGAVDFAVPPAVMAAARAAYGWHAADEELALLFDSAATVGAGLRATHHARQVTFGDAELTVECEVSEDGLVGQVLPATAARVEVLAAAPAPARPVQVDEDGWFAVRPLPPGPLSLRISVAGRPDVVTPWLPLSATGQSGGAAPSA